ncbi:MAG: AtpZ/AtpI family protein [Vicinamibacterales bacterium]
MPENDRDQSFERSLDAFQENIRKSGPAASAGYTLIGAILLLGGLGYAVDSWRGTGPWGLLVGLLLGVIVGFYELAKTVWRK